MTLPWKNYFFTVDFTDVSDFLVELGTGTSLTVGQAETLSTHFQTHDAHRDNRGQWCVREDECGFNTIDAKVVFNGPNSREFPTNGKYTHVLRLQLPKGNVVGKDVINVHYNRLED